MSDVATAAASGDRRKTLEAARDRLAKVIDGDDADARTLAGLIKELRAVVHELDSIPGDGEKADDVDEVAKKRAARIAAAAG